MSGVLGSKEVAVVDVRVGQGDRVMRRLALREELRRLTVVGMRRGELLGLAWSYVGLENRIIRVRFSLQRTGQELVLSDPKTARSQRTIPLPRFCVDALTKHRERQEKERANALSWHNEWGLVFTTRVGTAIEPRNLNRHFDALIKRAELPRVRFHDLRHTCALLLAEGEDPRVIMDTLGHSVIGTTLNLYTHVMPATQRAAAARMDSVLQPGEPGRKPGGSSSGSSSASAATKKAPSRRRKGR